MTFVHWLAHWYVTPIPHWYIRLPVFGLLAGLVWWSLYVIAGLWIRWQRHHVD